MSAPNTKKPKDGATILAKYDSEIYDSRRWIIGTYDANARIVRIVGGYLAWNRVLCWWLLPPPDKQLDDKTFKALDRSLQQKFGHLLPNG